jgi:endonuclease/exonuclease/phosphatase family metal-dependent hydrolase
VVLMGDFNEWRRQRRSALKPFGAGFGPLGRGVPSFPSYFPVLALDRIMARPQGILGKVEAHDSPLARLASDHLPVKARIRLADMAADEAAPRRAVRAERRPDA